MHVSKTVCYNNWENEQTNDRMYGGYTMTNEKKTDFFIGKLLEHAHISYTPNGSDLKEIQDALKTASKRGNKKAGYPEFTAMVNDFILVIEDKATPQQQALYENGKLSEDTKAICEFAENGTLHYAKHILKYTSFQKAFAFGCSGDEKRHKIRPIFVDKNGGYVLLPEVENFENFNEKNIDQYYHEQVLEEIPKEAEELETILKKSAELHEHLRNYGQLGDSEKPLIVSAVLLALCEKNFHPDQLNGDTIKTDGDKIYDALSDHMERVKVQPSQKKEQILNQFTLIKDRVKLNALDKRLGKTPLKFFTEYIHQHILQPVIANTPEDVLGRFYGEFIRYSGGDGQSLGVVLTPRHITELFCDLVDLQAEDIVFDPCCGTGGFLIAAMAKMLSLSHDSDDSQKNRIKKEQLHGIEVREDMFSIATTNMILRGDGKSNLICTDFLLCDPEKLRKNNYSVGFMNPPYSQAKNKETSHLSEIRFIQHLLDSMAVNGRVCVIVPQSAMVGKTKEDKETKAAILQNHTLEGVITLNKETFYRVGTNPCIAIFTAHKPHPKEKFCKFINFEDDGFVMNKHIGLVETERAKEKRAHLISCFRYHAPAENKFMVMAQTQADDEWLHSFYYFNDEIPKADAFSNTMADFLTFQVNMITHGRGCLFRESKQKTTDGKEGD